MQEIYDAIVEAARQQNIKVPSSVSMLQARIKACEVIQLLRGNNVQDKK